MSAGSAKSLADGPNRQGEREQTETVQRPVPDDESEQHNVTTVDLLEELEAEFVRLRAQNRRLTDNLKQARKEISTLKRRVESLEKKSARKKAAKPAPEAVAAAGQEHRERAAPKRQVLGKTLSQLRQSRRGPSEQNQSS